MTKDFDAIIIGGGHNGLVASAYMAKAGMSVLVLERRHLVGGACVTEELIPGFQFSSCAYLSWLLQPKVVKDLELYKHGLELYRLDPHSARPFPDGSGMLFWDDEERTKESVGRISPGDVEGYTAWTEFWDKAAEIMQPYMLQPPPTMEEVVERVRGTEHEDVLNTLVTVSMGELLDRYFESEKIKSCMVYSPDPRGLWVVGNALPSAYYACNRYVDPADTGLPRGGMGGLTRAMAASACSSGVSIRTSAKVNKVIIREGKAIGVELEDGEQIESAIVVSNADPFQTFRHLVGLENLDSAFSDALSKAKTDLTHLKFHCALREAPDFSRHFPDQESNKYMGMMDICPSPEYFQNSCRDTAEGRFTDSPILEFQVPTVLDDSLAPNGNHILSAFILHAPRVLASGSWDDARKETAEKLIDKITEYAPNFRGAVIDWVLITPEDMESRVGLTNGNIHHLDLVDSQMLSNRPLPGWSDYRTPIKGLYLCGAGTHPGGEVTGAPGHNAAHQVIKDWAS